MAGVIAEQKLFWNHLHELRNRLLGWLLTLIAGALGAYVFRDFLFDVVSKPLGQDLFYTSPGGGFFFMMTISLLVGFIVSVPVLIYNFIKFIEPAMPGNLGSRMAGFIMFSILMGLAGVGFAYQVSLPATLNFLTDFGGDNILPLISANEYLRFLVSYLAGFVLAFQLPIVLLAINKVSPLSTKKLGYYRRYFIVFSIVIAAVLTPTPDPVNQFIMAAPMVLLYEASIPLVALNNRKKPKQIVLGE